jgi:hypothetical protein
MTPGAGDTRKRLTKAVKDLIVTTMRLSREAALWRTARAGPLKSDGVELVARFLGRDDCDRLIAWTDQVLESGETFLGPDTWLVRRVNDVKGKDTEVRQIMNAHLVDRGLESLARDRVFERAFESRLGWPVRLESMTVQVDDPDLETKRGWHVDRFTPPTFKAFVYLTDVDGPANGPYTVIPGSHRHIARKLTNLAANAVKTRPRTDLRHGYAKQEPRLLTGPAGTCVLSVQTIAHRGWPGHSERRRYVVVAYLSLESSPREEFRLGRDQARRDVGAG